VVGNDPKKVTVLMAGRALHYNVFNPTLFTLIHADEKITFLQLNLLSHLSQNP